VLGNYQEAINNYSSALKIDPTQAAVYYEIAGLLSLNKDFSGALEYARKAVDKDKTGNIYFKLLLAKTYKDNNQPANAAAILEEILKVQPDDFLLYFELSKTYQELKKYSQAIRIMNVAERKFGIIEQISLEKEKIYFLIGDKNKAVKEIERLAASFPSNINYKALLAETYVNNGMIDKAQKILNEIENETFEDGIVYLSIAEFYRLIGEYNKTMEFVRKAFESENVELDIKVELLISFLDVMGTDKEFIGEIGKLIQIISEMYPNEIKVRAVSADFYIITRN
jgi:tetratricopeptide (TPR) repeat protein